MNQNTPSETSPVSTSGQSEPASNARPKRGYVARGECRQSDSCYQMGCPNEPCLTAHRRKVKAQRLTRLNLGRISHGPVGYDCGCRCDACVPARARKYKQEALAEIARLTQGGAA